MLARRDGRAADLLSLPHSLSGNLSERLLTARPFDLAVDHSLLDTRRRVTLVMNLLWLAPDIQEELLCRFAPGCDAPPLRERDLRAVAALSRWDDQRACRGALRRGCSGDTHFST